MKLAKVKPFDLMGHLVVVDAVYRKETRYVANGLHTRQMSYLVLALPEPRTGWYVGERNLRTGKVIPGSYEEPAYFEGGGNIKAHAVVFWPTMAPVLVPQGCMRLSLGPPGKCGDPAPWPPGGSPKERAVTRAQYAASAKDIRRDAKGRFTTD